MRETHGPDGRVRKCLETWGEIATYLNVEIRTAQRWEKKMLLPVRRLDGSQAVYAFADELDDWRGSRERSAEEAKPASPLGIVSSDLPAPFNSVVATDPSTTLDGTRANRGSWRWFLVGMGMLVALAVGATMSRPLSRAPQAQQVPDTFDIVNLDPPAGSVALGGNVEPEWGVYVTLQYSLRSRDAAWLCIIAEVEPAARSGSICGDPVLLRRGTGTARTRVIVTNTTSNGPVLTKRFRLIAAPENLCRPVPGNFNSHDASCFPNPFVDRFETAEFAWTHPGAANRVGVLAVSAESGATILAGRDVSVTVSYLLQDAPKASICIRPLINNSLDEAEPSGPRFRCSNTEVDSGFGTAIVSFALHPETASPFRTAGFRIEMKGHYLGFVPYPLNWTNPRS